MNYNFKKFLLFIPALLIMITIFIFSSQDSDDSTETSLGFTKNVVSFVDSSFHLDLSDSEENNIAEEIEGFIRKLAHFTEYMALGISIILPLYCFNVSNYILPLSSEVFCFLYACSDELHQKFVPGRSCSFLDVLIDSAGALTGTLIVFIIIKRRNRINRVNVKRQSVG